MCILGYIRLDPQLFAGCLFLADTAIFNTLPPQV